MKITDVRLRTVKNENELKLKAYADVTFDECFVAMPSRKMPDGEYKDIVHPITPELRKDITDSVIAKYNEMGLEEEVVAAVE